jgi:sortase A
MKFKRWSRYFIIIFLISFLIINWNEVSWIFNVKAILGFFSDFLQHNFQQENVLAEEKLSGTNDLMKKNNSLEIPKINVSAPLLFAGGQEKNISKLLEKGVVHYQNSALPGETGQTIILGHSAPLGWPKIKYDWIFSRLADLTKGDKIFVYYNHRKYLYRVQNKIFLNRGEELPQFLTKSGNVLILISCWPPGKDFKRIAVIAETLTK